MRHGEFRFYSLGIVSENKTLDSDLVLAVPVEILPMLDGELGVENVPVESQGKDSFNRDYTVTVNERNSLTCKWLQLGSNRHTPPDVRRGERVGIYRYADSDTFYWVSLGLDDHLRRLETVVYLWSGLPDGQSDDPLTVENSYVLEVSTHNKQITLSTSKSNEEPHTYIFQFNTAEGVVTLTDDIGNYFQLDSPENTFTLINADKSHFIMNKENIDIHVEDSITATASKTIGLTCTDFTLNASASVTVDAGADIKVTAGGGIDLTAGGTIKITAPSTKMDSVVEIKELKGLDGGAITVSSAIASSEGGTFAKSVVGPDAAI